MMIRRLLLLTLSSSLLAACMGSADAPKSEAVSTQYNAGWINDIPTLSSEIRACIITHKSTKNIRYAERTANRTAVILEKEGGIVNCEVDPNSYKVVATTPYNNNIPNDLARFYPYGKSPSACQNRADVHDERGRLMGITCR